MSDAQWWERTACADHPSPQLWYPHNASHAEQAIKICRKQCPDWVRIECGREADDSDERVAVRGGFYLKRPEDRRMLRESLGRRTGAPEKFCARCGRRFNVKATTLCSACVGVEPIAAARAHVNELLAADMSASEIAAAAQVSTQRVRTLAAGFNADGRPARTVRCDIAARIMAVPVPQQVHP